MNWNGETESGAHIDFEASSAAFLSDFSGEESGYGYGGGSPQEGRGMARWASLGRIRDRRRDELSLHHTGETAANMTVPGMKPKPVD